MGAAKLQRYGDAFLEALGDGEAPAQGDPWAADGTGVGADEAGPLFAAAADPAPAVPDPLAALDTEGLDSVEVTRELVLQGYRPEAVASMRGLKVRTVEDHLAELVRRGDLTAEEATGLPADEVRRIQEVAEAVAEEAPGKLRPVFDAPRAARCRTPSSSASSLRGSAVRGPGRDRRRPVPRRPRATCVAGRLATAYGGSSPGARAARTVSAHRGAVHGFLVPKGSP